MSTTVPPSGETERLVELKRLNLAEGTGDERLDRVTRLAIRVFDVPVAWVEFVERDRESVESLQGVASRAVLRDGTVVVADALADSDLADNPLMLGDRPARFFAAQPIHGPGGSPVGALSIADVRPRTFGAGDVALLRDLVSTIERELVAATFKQTEDLRRVQTQEELERLGHRHALILNSAGDGIIGMDGAGRVTFANPGAARMTGYTVDEMIGQRLHDLIHHTRVDGTSYPFEVCPLIRVLQSGSTRRVTGEVFWRKNGTSFPVEYVSAPIPEGEEIVGAVLTFKDISERHAIERMKDEFVSVVSHELRTPLTSIRGSLGLLASGLIGSLPDRAQRMLDIAVKNTDRLVNLINDILDIERIESGKVTMQKQDCDAADLIAQAAEVVQGLAEKAGLVLAVSPLGAPLFADPDRVVQVLTNLLGNAIKFSSAGGTVWLDAERRGDEVVFRVRDQGRGIPSDKLERIFERFQQVDTSDSREKGGTGLGLAICRSIAHQHGGRIWAESGREPVGPDLGPGSSFFLSLPVAPAERGAAPALPSGLADGVELPPGQGATSGVQEQANDALAGLWERFKAANLDRVSVLDDVVRTALDAPIDPDLCREAEREAHKLAGAVGTFGFTRGSALAREIEQIFQAPSELDQPAAARLSGLVVALRDELEKSIDLPENAEAAPLTDGPSVLAVDDDPLVLAVLRALLRPRGLRLTTVDDPLQFWRVMRETSPDLVMLDFDMPHLTGIELCRALRDDARWASTPVLFLTARTDANSVCRLFGAGADDYVAKPIVGPELITRITNRLERVRLYRSLAETDFLTGVANPRRASQVLDQLIHLATRNGVPLCLSVVDLDRFKSVNDRFGHAAGDAVLRRVGAIFRRCFRGSDLVARWGGEEFILGMYGMTREDAVQRVAAALDVLRRERFSDDEGATYSVTFSAGIAQFPEDGTAFADLFRAADEALYGAKAAGRDRVLPAATGSPK